MHTLTHFNVADFIILGIVLLSILISLLRGFIREAVSLATWLIAAYMAFTYSSEFSAKMAGLIHSSSARMVIAFVSIFFGIVILGAILNFFVGKITNVTGLGFLDRILGILFGAARGILVVALILLMFKGTALIERHWWKESQLIPEFAPITKQMEALFPKKLVEEKSNELKNSENEANKELNIKDKAKNIENESNKEIIHENKKGVQNQSLIDLPPDPEDNAASNESEHAEENIHE